MAPKADDKVTAEGPKASDVLGQCLALLDTLQDDIPDDDEVDAPLSKEDKRQRIIRSLAAYHGVSLTTGGILTSLVDAIEKNRDGIREDLRDALGIDGR
jgi:hypothetical protein